MRIIKGLLSFIFSIALIVSIAINVVLSMSTSNSLIFKDNYEARKQLAATSIMKLTTALAYGDGITVSAIYTDPDTNEITREIASCEFISNEDYSYLSCAMISRLYNGEDLVEDLVSTTYYPGDGYKYVIEGTNKTSTAFNDEEIWTTTISEIMAKYALETSILLIKEAASEDESYTYSTKTSFDINTFSLIKIIDCTYKNSDSTSRYQFTFDGHDRITNLIIGDTEELSFTYDYTKLQFPSFEGFVLVA